MDNKSFNYFDLEKLQPFLSWIHIKIQFAITDNQKLQYLFPLISLCILHFPLRRISKTSRWKLAAERRVQLSLS